MTLFNSIASISHRFLQVFAVRLLPIIFPLFFIFTPVFAENGGNSNAVEFSQAELDQILAPIALYPDTVLSQVLIAATYPIEVVQADRWARANTKAKGSDAVRLVESKDWDPSVKALVAFPDILQRMSDDVDWTQKVGDAFLTDEGRVMDSIQNLRKKAYASGSLNKVKHLKVQRDNDEIVIEPAEERVVYVPVYDTRVVYGNWWWPEYPPIYWHYPSHYTHYSHVNYVSSFYWGPSIYIGPTFFYSSFHWHNRHVVVVDHHHHRRHHHNSYPHYYTGRSIVHHEGARAWRHEPTHRRGVAYYNNNLRNTYGSRQESYRDARVYRDQHRDKTHHERRGNDAQRHTQTRFDEKHRANSRINQLNDTRLSNDLRRTAPADQATNANSRVDRAEQLRGRMQRQTDVNNNSREHLTRSDRATNREASAVNREAGAIENRNDARRDIRNHEQNKGQNNDRVNTNRLSNSQTETRPARDTANDQERNSRVHRGMVNTTREQPTQAAIENNNSGARPERIQQERMQRTNTTDRTERTNPNINRPTRTDDSMSRRVEATRGSPRPERTNNDGGNRMQRNDSRDEGGRR